MMGALVFKVGYGRKISIYVKPKNPERRAHTFTGNRKKNNAAGLGNVGRDEALDHLNITLVAASADACDQP